MSDDLSTLRRRSRPEPEQGALFDLPPDWARHWWGMPSFEVADARPLYRITVNFISPDDLEEFARRLGVAITRRTDSMWFPPERLDRPNEWEYTDE